MEDRRFDARDFRVATSLPGIRVNGFWQTPRGHRSLSSREISNGGEVRSRISAAPRGRFARPALARRRGRELTTLLPKPEIRRG